MEKSDLTISEKYRNHKKQEEYLKTINNHVKNEKEKPLNKKDPIQKYIIDFLKMDYYKKRIEESLIKNGYLILVADALETNPININTLKNQMKDLIDYYEKQGVELIFKVTGKIETIPLIIFKIKDFKDIKIEDSIHMDIEYKSFFNQDQGPLNAYEISYFTISLSEPNKNLADDIIKLWKNNIKDKKLYNIIRFNKRYMFGLMLKIIIKESKNMILKDEYSIFYIEFLKLIESDIKCLNKIETNTFYKINGIPDEILKQIPKLKKFTKLKFILSSYHLKSYYLKL